MQAENEDIFFEDFQQELWLIGNHHFYGIYSETFEQRGNDMLERSIDYLTKNPKMSTENKMRIKCLQFYIAGFLTGQNMTIHEKNRLLTKDI